MIRVGVISLSYVPEDVLYACYIPQPLICLHVAYNVAWLAYKPSNGRDK